MIFVVVAVLVSGAVEFAVRRAQAAERARAEAETMSALAGPELERPGIGARDARARARNLCAWSRCRSRCERAAAASGSTSSTSAGRRPARRRRFASTCRAARDVRLVGRGPALFAEDQRVLRRVRGCGANCIRGPASERRGRGGAEACHCRPSAHRATRGCRTRPAHAARRRSRRPSSTLRQTTSHGPRRIVTSCSRRSRTRPIGSMASSATCSTRAGCKRERSACGRSRRARRGRRCALCSRFRRSRARVAVDVAGRPSARPRRPRACSSGCSSTCSTTPSPRRQRGAASR